MTLCPVCRNKDQTCKVRFLGERPLYSCKGCFEREEQRQPPRRPEADPLSRLGYPPTETITPR